MAQRILALTFVATVLAGAAAPAAEDALGKDLKATIVELYRRSEQLALARKAKSTGVVT